MSSVKKKNKSDIFSLVYDFMRGWHYRAEVVKFICSQEDSGTEGQLGPHGQTADVQTQR